MKTKIISILALVGLMFNANAESPVWGTYKVECPANSDTYIGITTTRAPVFTGKVQSVQNGTTNIVAQGEPNWSANQFVYVAGSQTDHYYLKFTSGELEGAWYDIKSNSTSDVEIEIGSAELAKIGVNDTFEIIPHWTLATLFPNGGGFTKSTGRSQLSGASLVYKYTSYDHSNGLLIPIGTNKAYMKLYYYRGTATDIGWRCSSETGVLDATNDVVEPNSFFCVHQPENASAGVSFNGVIPMCATTIEAFLTKDESGKFVDQDVYIVSPSATDISLSDLTTALIDGNVLKASGRAVAEYMYIYSNDATAKNRAASKLLFYRSNQGWKKATESGTVDADNDMIKAGSILLIAKKSQNAEVTIRSNFQPKYTTNN